MSKVVATKLDSIFVKSVRELANAGYSVGTGADDIPDVLHAAMDQAYRIGKAEGIRFEQARKRGLAATNN